MEHKLEQYRKKKKRIELYENFKARIRKMFIGNEKKSEDLVINIHEEQKSDEACDMSVNSDSTEECEETTGDDVESTVKKRTMLDYITYITYFLFWATLYAIAIQLKFGIVYFMLSMLVFMYLNTRTGPKMKNEKSAYSVFNPNVESIDGTLTASQFEREMGLKV